MRMDRVVRSNQGDEPRVSNRRSTEIVPYKEQNNNDGSNKSSGHKGHGINIGMSAAGHRNMRPELRNNWRQALALKNESDDEEDEDDEEEGGVSIIPAGIRPGWVWGPSAKDISASREKEKKRQDEEGSSQTNKESKTKTQRPFVPSNIVLGQPPVLTLDNARKAVLAGIKMNPNYRGALTSFHIENASATALENCAVRVHGIHPDATVKDILDKVHTGKIYSVNRCPPQAGVIETAAADIVFLTHAAAKAFMVVARTGIFVRGSRLQVRWNRNKVKEPKNILSTESRVIRISGPEEKLSVRILEDFFKKYFHFQLVDSKSWRSASSRKTYELGFESIRPQATWARRVFKQQFQGGNMREFRIWFGPDPCDNSEKSDRQDRLAQPWRRGSEIDNVDISTRWRFCDSEEERRTSFAYVS